MTTWKWKQPSGEIFTVQAKGKIIEATNESGVVVLHQELDTEDGVKFIEENFLRIVAIEGTEVEQEQKFSALLDASYPKANQKPVDDFLVMYA